LIEATNLLPYGGRFFLSCRYTLYIIELTISIGEYVEKTRNWQVEIEGVQHRIQFFPKISSFDQDVVEADGVSATIKPVGLSTLSGFEHVIAIGETEMYLRVRGREADLSVNGIFLNSGKAYAPLIKYPAWEIVYMLLHPTWWLTAGLIISVLARDVEVLVGAVILWMPYLRFCIKTATSNKPTNKKIIYMVLYGIAVFVLSYFVFIY